MTRTLLLALALVFSASPSRADVVTFDRGAGQVWAPCVWASPCGEGVRNYATWYREGLMNVEGSFWLFGNNARQIQIDGNGQTFELAGFGAFDLFQITLVATNSSWDVPSTFRSSSGAEMTFAPGGTYVFPEEGWRGITSFTWRMPNFPYPGFELDDTAILDNVVFTPVPEPSMTSLLLIGAAGIAVRVRRRRA